MKVDLPISAIPEKRAILRPEPKKVPKKAIVVDDAEDSFGDITDKAGADETFDGVGLLKQAVSTVSNLRAQVQQKGEMSRSNLADISADISAI